jgi:hypothetical protein
LTWIWTQLSQLCEICSLLWLESSRNFGVMGV